MTRPAAREERITLWAVVGRQKYGYEWMAHCPESSKRGAVWARNWLRNAEPTSTFVLRPITAVLKLAKPKKRSR